MELIKIHMKSDCTIGSAVKGRRQPSLHGFASDKPPAREINLEPRFKLLKKKKQICFE